VLVGPATAAAAGQPAASGCLKCHAGIEQIRESGSGMLKMIRAFGKDRGDPAGCVVCHGGDPKATDKEQAHGGEFYPDPGSPWVNEKTCGQCHDEHVAVQWTSLMMTEAGKIQGVAWSFGAMTGYQHKWGNYAVESLPPEEWHGTAAFRSYMQGLKKLEPQVFVDRFEPLPPAPTDPAELVKNPKLAAFTYMRNQCLRCHWAVKGRYKRGDYRGMGCSACHIPYSNEGRYEGGDPTIPKDEPGHCLVHTIQATREAKTTVNGVTYSGIPVETCTTCHDRGKRIGVSYQGLMEIPYHSPFAEDGSGQPDLHTKHYIALHQDIHYQKGMLCQDCHTTIDVHSSGMLVGANLGAVEIECADCHGTPDAYPWELPLGFGDEYRERPAVGPPRGVAKKLLELQEQGTVYEARDGYLISARGNPIGNVVRAGNMVIVHTAAGKDIELKPLKLLAEQGELSLKAKVAMGAISEHIERLECYACHAAWTAQCYGCHVRIDYSKGNECFDWLAAGHMHAQPQHRSERDESGYKTIIPGKVKEERSYTRWEDPMLGLNGEGRISPIAPGCQPSITVIGPEGKPVLLNHIFRTPAGLEWGGSEGQLCIDMSPTQPHTMTKHARSCESCHASEKALGYGIGGGRIMRRPDKPIYVDLETPEGKVLSRLARVQFAAVQGLSFDWSRVVTPEGKQVQTVGHHFKLSRALNNEERQHMSRAGICLSCHKEIPSGSLAVSLLHHIAAATGQIPTTPAEHDAHVHHIMLTVAWVQVGAGPLVLVVVLALLWRIWRRKRSARPAGE